VPGPGAASAERARHLVAILLRHPGLLHDVEEAFGAVALPEQHDRLRHAILAWGSVAETLDSAALMTHLTSVGLAAEAAQALSAVPAPLAGCASPDAMPAEAEAGWWHFFGLMNPMGLDVEIAAAMHDFSKSSDSFQRLVTLVEARNALRRGEADEA
jgi:DNA primase